MEKGAVVEFSVKGQPRLAVVDGPEGKSSLRVTDTFGNSLTVASRDVVFSTTHYRLAEKAWSSAAGLADWVERSRQARADVDLATVWELLAGDGSGTQGLEDLAGCLWDSLSGERAHALFSVLSEDKLYFKEKGGRYEPRPASQVEELRKQQAAVAGKERLQAALVARLTARISDRAAVLEADDLRRLEAVKNVALWGEEAPEKHTGLELLKWLGRPQTDASAFHLLVELGVWNRHENLDVHRAGLATVFAPELEREAQVVTTRRSEPATVLDLTHLASVTIDDESTTEVDDALAVEVLANGDHRYWIHIADPGRWIEPGSALDLEARRRGTTVYLPTGRYTMFPTSLAEGPFSLTEGVESPALSFGCQMGVDGALGEFTVTPSRIRVSRRLSYHQAQDLYGAGDVLIGQLAEAAQRREAWRIAQGAVMIQLPESDVDVDLEANTVSVGIYTADQARDWVAEFMVLAGEIAARFAREKSIPVLYRVQKAGDAVDVSHLPEGPAREFAKIVSMTRSSLSVEPGPHAGLGLECYVQATSPIRRYGDLAVHRQLKAAAAGEAAPLTAEELALLASELDPLNAQASKLERNAVKYWITEYLSRNKGQNWDATIVGWFREDETQAQVLFTSLGLRSQVKLTRKHALGDVLRLKVAAADARKDVLTLQEV